MPGSAAKPHLQTSNEVTTASKPHSAQGERLHGFSPTLQAGGQGQATQELSAGQAHKKIPSCRIGHRHAQPADPQVRRRCGPLLEDILQIQSQQETYREAETIGADGGQEDSAPTRQADAQVEEKVSD